MISPVKPWRSKSYFANVWWDKRTRTRIKRTLVFVGVYPKIIDYRTRTKTDVTICLVRIFDTDFSDEQNELSIWNTVPKWTKWPFLLLIKDKIIKRNDFSGLSSFSQNTMILQNSFILFFAFFDYTQGIIDRLKGVLAKWFLNFSANSKILWRVGRTPICGRTTLEIYVGTLGRQATGYFHKNLRIKFHSLMSIFLNARNSIYLTINI